MRAASLVRRAQLLAGVDVNHRVANHDSINDLRDALERPVAASEEAADALEQAVTDAVKAGTDVLHEMPRPGGADRAEAPLVGTAIPSAISTANHALLTGGVSTPPRSGMIAKVFNDGDASHLVVVLAGLADLLDAASQDIFAAAGGRNPLRTSKPSAYFRGGEWPRCRPAHNILAWLPEGHAPKGLQGWHVFRARLRQALRIG